MRSEAVAGKYLRAVLAGDRLKASDVVVKAVQAGLPVAECYEGVLAPVQRELGKRWREGASSIADERVGLESARRHAEDLRLQAKVPIDRMLEISAAAGLKG